jgi:hypothetical protein
MSFEMPTPGRLDAEAHSAQEIFTIEVKQTPLEKP